MNITPSFSLYPVLAQIIAIVIIAVVKANSNFISFMEMYKINYKKIQIIFFNYKSTRKK